jgi:2-haloacid dehalogenase
LEFCLERFSIRLDADGQAALGDSYFALKPHIEVPAALAGLKSLGIPLGVLSNGSSRSIGLVASNAGIADYFDQLISVEAIEVFKPDPRVYALGQKNMGMDRDSILFVSSNAWDATGAAHFGFPTCWVNRSQNKFDRMGQRPTVELKGIDDLIASEVFKFER